MNDGCVFLGRNPTTGRELTPEGLIAHLDFYGGGAAVAGHYRSIFLDFRSGNEELLHCKAAHPDRIVPAVFVSPYGLDPARDRDLLQQWRERGAQVLLLSRRPNYYEIRFDTQVMRWLVAQAAKLGYSLLFVLDGPGDLGEAERLCGDFSGPVLARFARGGVYQALADLLRLAVDRENWFFDLGSLTQVGGIQRLVAAAGARRCFFASGAPESEPLAAWFLLAAADLSETDRDMVLGGTLANLFDLPPRAFSKQVCEEAREWFSRPKVDTHYHLGGMNLVEPCTTIEAAFREFERFNYLKAVVSSTLALNYDVQAGNAETFSWVDSDKRVYGLIVIDPTRLQMSLREIERWSMHPKAVGLKTIQDFYGLELDAAEYAPILKANAQGPNLTVMAHIPGLAQAAMAFPHTRFVCAHTTWGRILSRLGPSNVWYDLSTSHNDAAESDLYRLAKEAGAERLLFSSDAPLINPAWTLGKLAGSRLPHETVDKVLRENALAAFPKLAEPSGL